MDGPAVTYRVQKGYQAMHPSLVEKPKLSVADLHLIGKLFFGDGGLTPAEGARLDALGDVFDDYLLQVVGPDWGSQPALVP